MKFLVGSFITLVRRQEPAVCEGVRDIDIDIDRDRDRDIDIDIYIHQGACKSMLWILRVEGG